MEEHSLVCCPSSFLAVHPETKEVRVWRALHQLEMSVRVAHAVLLDLLKGHLLLGCLWLWTCGSRSVFLKEQPHSLRRRS